MWDEWHVVWDRAAGAMVGGAAARLLVGEDPQPAEEYLAGIGGQAREAIRDLTAGPRELPGTPLARHWAAAVQRGVVDGILPDPVFPDSAHPAAVGWRAAAETPTPPLDPARGLFPCTQLTAAVQRAYTQGGLAAAQYAGVLAGARWGVSAIPLSVQRELAAATPQRVLVTAALVAARGPDPAAWPQRDTQVVPGLDREHRQPFAIPHPHDPGVVLCTMEYVRDSTDADAVVSLCRMGTRDHPPHLPRRDIVEVWLHDLPGANPNLHFVLDEAARMVAQLRDENKRVLLHCAACQSRTPAVAARYASAYRGADVVAALREIITTVAGHLNNPELSRAAAELAGVELPDPAAVLFPEGLPTLTRAPRI
mgnify:CR=1 FL=1